MHALLSMHDLVAADRQAPEFDFRHLPAPEPMQLALEAADALQPGQAIQVLTPRTPLPLLELLAARGMHTLVFALSNGEARIWIRCPDDHDTPGN